MLKAKVTDRDDKPIEGAEVAWLDWFDPNAEKPVDAVTDQNGEFEILERVGKDSSFVIIHKTGYAVGAMNMAYLPARVRLWPMKPVALRIVDPQQQPVEGAIVTLANVHFNEEHLEANVPANLAAQTQAVSRADGWAILRSVRPEFLESVAVTAEGYGNQTFTAEFGEKKFHVLQLWESTKLQVQILEGDTPAKGWKLTASPDGEAFGGDPLAAIKTNPINGNLLPSGINFFAATDNEGRLTIPNALVRRPVMYYLVDSADQLRSSKSITADGEETKAVTIKVRPPIKEIGIEVTGRLVDAKTGDPIGGIELSFTNYNEFPYPTNAATSTDNGDVAVALTPGLWRWTVVKKPAGKHIRVDDAAEFLIDERSMKLPDLKIHVRPSQTIKGTIRDVDLAIRRARWIHVSGTDADGTTTQEYGTFQADGTFAINFPADAKADGFDIVAVGGGSDTLVVVSENPLVLTSTAVDEDADE
ncbi:MAG: hypothetical protein WBD20_23685 [Pirellulaceae bacterium]